MFGLLKRKPRRRRAVIVGLDGVPYTFLSKQIAAGKMPHLARLMAEGSFVQADSIHPCVSCVAWTSYMTGRNPGKHDIYGFLDRRPGTYDTYIPNGRNLQGKTVWEILSDRGKRVISLNIPVTYPPREINGLLVGGFLSPKLSGATHPPELAKRLADIGYRIDVEPGKGRDDKQAFLTDLHEVFEARKRAALTLMAEEDWDVFQVHIMGTDRINHFFFEHWEHGDPTYAPAFDEFYLAVDAFVGEVVATLDEDTAFLCLSDHGFCSIKREVYLNKWLETESYLEPLSGERPKLSDLTDATRAYCMDPGRIYLNVEGREPRGSVAPGAQYEDLRTDIAEGLRSLMCRETGEPVIKQVLRREDFYHGSFFDHAPDLVAAPFDGYDLKGPFAKPELFGHSGLVGMHTHDDAFWYVRGRELSGRPEIMDGAPTVLALLGEEPEPEMDGKSLV